MLLILYSAGLPAAIATAPLDPDAAPRPLGAELFYLADPDGRLDYDDLAALPAERWQRSRREMLNLGFTSDPHWFRFELINGPEAARYLLQLAYPVLDWVDLFVDDGSAVRHFRSGDRRPFAARPVAHRTFVFPLTPQPGQRLRVTLRVQTSSSLQLPLSVAGEARFWRETQKSLVAHGMYYGLMLAMLLYNLFIFTRVRDPSYMLYALFVLSFALFQLCLQGYAYQYLWPDKPLLNGHVLTLSLNAAIAFAGLFVISFLRLHHSLPRCARLLGAVALAAALVAAVSPLLGYRGAVYAALGLSCSAVLLGLLSGILRWRQGFRPAGYFLAAWVALLTGVLLFALNKIGLLPRTLLTEYSMQVGSALEVLLLSFALAYRINSDRVQKEIALRAQAVAEASAAAKSQFLANMSHEIRTPMNGVLGMLELLRKSPLDATQRRYAEVSHQSGLHLLAVINDVLDFSRIESGRIDFEETELEPLRLLRETCLPFETQAREKNLSFDLELDGPDATLLGDPLRLRQILNNLLGNAIKFTDGGGVRVGARLTPLDQLSTELYCEVADTGVGIDAAARDVVFESFAQADSSTTRRFGGTGLGLAISKRLIEQMGGAIGVDSTPGQGSRFWITLPLRRAPGQTAR